MTTFYQMNPNVASSWEDFENFDRSKVSPREYLVLSCICTNLVAPANLIAAETALTKEKTKSIIETLCERDLIQRAPKQLKANQNIVIRYGNTGNAISKTITVKGSGIRRLRRRSLRLISCYIRCV